MAEDLDVDPAGLRLDAMRHTQQLAGLASAHSTYRFVATVTEQCPGQASHSRDIGVLAIVDMGYWQPYYFE